MIRVTRLGLLLVLSAALVACGDGEADTTAAVSDTAQPTSVELFADLEMSRSMELSLGTLMLEGTADAVTAAQAQELLPLWQMLKALHESGTASEAETEAVLDQIQDAMMPQQLEAIEDMNQEDMQDLMQKLGMAGQGDTGSGEGGDFRPPDVMPPEGGQAPAGMDPSGLSALSPEEQATLMAERMNSGFGTAQTGEVIQLLQTRSAEL